MKDRFYVGQRVKLVRSITGQVPVGTHGTVVGPLMTRRTETCPDGEPCYLATLDGFRSLWHEGLWSPKPHQLAPLYDGDEKTAWSESAWKPMHLRGVSVSPPENVEAK